MRAGAPDEVLSGVCSWSCAVASWLGGDLRAASVPVLSGRVVGSVTSMFLERLTLTVPRYAGGKDWRPGNDPRHPLARFGQELQVSVLVGSTVTSQTWETRVGRFVIVDWDDDDEGNVSVVADGLLRHVQTDLLASPLQPRPGGTLVSEARRLLPAGMGAAFDATLVDRVCPTGMSWSEDRLDALKEIAEAWPALLRTDEWGQIHFKSPLSDVPAPVLTLKDGPRGTVVRVPRADTREGAINRAIVRSSATGAADVQAVVDQTKGPTSVSGDYKVVARSWSSPLVTTVAECEAAGRSMIANAQRPSQALPVTCAPDPRIALDDPIEVIRDGARAAWGWVTGYDLPLTVADGAMRVDVGASA